MEQKYKDLMRAHGYDQLVCDIFNEWEYVKDEILIYERKSGTGSGTIHVFLGAADNELRKEFHDYYEAVEDGQSPDEGAIEIKHFFLPSNILSMVGHMLKYDVDNGSDYSERLSAILSIIKNSFGSELLETKSLFKLSTGSSKLRPYFKQFDSKGIFSTLVRQLLLPNSAYKISLFKNQQNQYAAFWLLGFAEQDDFSTTLEVEVPKAKENQSEKQIIYYGAPGTGKSFAIEEQTKDEDVIRTTFHPDSDYSTFVGCYKPTTIDVPMRDVTGKVIVEKGEPVTEKRIVYEFVNQAFLQAYVGAWQKMAGVTIDKAQKQYLVIEEINRGNCAQIFGDLFQLLDRNRWGFSEYPIKADADMKKQIKKQLTGLTFINGLVISALFGGKDIVGQVLEGDILLLPPNLFIWATMNTSDQSLFPIDSAFKRRWDWKYVPIANAGLNWAIEVKGKKYDWWDFLKKINALIGETTNSEDKKLGYFFCKTETGIIDAESFVGKVIFYLWNDVFKDFEFEGDVFVDTDGETKLTFDKFYKPDATVQESSVEVFLNNLGVMLLGEVPAKDEDAPADDEEEPVGRTRYLINGDKFKRKSYFGKEIMMQFIKSHPELTYQEIKDLFPDSLMGDTTYKGLIASTDTQLGSYARYYSPETLTSADGVSYKIFKQWTYQNIGNIINFGKEHGFNIEIIEE
jgi:5-methylcytosine-specific restriction endonuclease McrBC GTP-binding regulatory subunit McrB